MPDNAAHYDVNRRRLLKAGVSAATLSLVLASGLSLPQRVMAHWPKVAFSAKTAEDALRALVGDAEMIEEDSAALVFKVGSPPSYAVNGASVPVEIRSNLSNIERLIVVVDNNPVPLIISAELTPAVKLPFKTLIKMAKDSNVTAVISADGKLYRTTRFVEVDIGGCG